MNRYDKYKATNIEWIGEIPNHWDLKKLKYVANLKSGDSITSDEIRPEGDYPVYGGNGLRGYTSTYTHEGDFVLIGRQGALCGNINYTSGKFFASEHAVVVSIFNGSDFFLLGELLRSMNLNQYSQASAQPGLSVEKIQNLIIPIAPPCEQAIIANFLYEKTAQINKLIDNKTKLIELLKEERAVIINKAVGDEGGKWERKKLKYLAKINPSKPTIEFDKKSDEEVVFLPMEKVSEGGDINQDIKKKISDVSSGFTYFEKNDVIVAKITPCFENGKGALLNKLETDFGFGSTEFHTLRAKKPLLPKFLYYTTKSELFMSTGEAFMTGSAGQKRVPTSYVENFTVCIPSIEQQTETLELIETAIQKIDNTITKIAQEIQLMLEYKTALISEVVTGKLKVI